jgi:hypothetical protein
VEGVAEVRCSWGLSTKGGRRVDRRRANGRWGKGVVVWVRRVKRGGGVRRVVAVAVVAGHDSRGCGGGVGVDAPVGWVDGWRCICELVSRLGKRLFDIGWRYGVFHLFVLVFVVLIVVVAHASHWWWWKLGGGRGW